MVFWKNPFLTEIWPFLCHGNSCFQGSFGDLEDSKRPKNRFLRLKNTPDVLQNGPGPFWEKSVLVEKNVFFDPLERTRGPRRATRHWVVLACFESNMEFLACQRMGNAGKIIVPLCVTYLPVKQHLLFELWPKIGHFCLFLACFWPVFGLFWVFLAVLDVKTLLNRGLDLRKSPQIKILIDRKKKKRPKRPIFGYFRPFLSFFLILLHNGPATVAKNGDFGLKPFSSEKYGRALSFEPNMRS